jgi:6,7-dimethyl-8-ribityllumazine synthase
MKQYVGKTIGMKKTFAIVVARFNEFITKRLLDSAITTLEQAGVPEKNIHVIWVPGALEIPQFCKKATKMKKMDGVIALGCVLRGGTYHFETVSNEVTRGVSQVALETGVPIATGIITADTLEQAIDRAGLKAGNKGAHAAMAALELANLNDSLTTKS